MKARSLLVPLLLLLCRNLTAQIPAPATAERPAGGRYSLLSFTAAPFLSIPIGGDAGILGLGGGAGVAAEYRLPALPFVYAGGGLDYSFVSTPDPATSFSALGLAAASGVNIQLLPVLSMKVFGSLGYFLAFFNGPGIPPGGNPSLSIKP